MNELISLSLGVLSHAFMLLFIFNLLKIDYYNPIVKGFVNIYKPISKVSIFSNQLLTIFIITIVLRFSSEYIGGSKYDVYTLGLISLISVLYSSLTIFFFSIIGAVILSWVAPNNPNPLLQIIEEISSKLLTPIRNFVPSAGGLDFSPIFAFILIRQLQILLSNIYYSII